ncbi:XrtA/PEP-CTERM system TPR-repeat protein PrsT, partial [Salinisphaera sp.]|uniref:XrtA/PEP-CTERM system TPR-repeat protein PrsT n=1 Tax=Salinisphaera sp. TaxID=1914330 RepID=UPI002D77CB1A
MDETIFYRRPSIREMIRVVPLCLAGAMLVAGCSFSSPEQRVDKARQAYQEQDYHAAEVQLKTVLREHPDNGDAWALLGHTSLANRKYEDAIHQFKQAKANGQPAAALALPFGRALVANGQYEKALKTLQAVPQNAPDHVRALAASLRGDAQAGLGHRDRAGQAYAAALSIEPGLSDALQGQARLALQAGDVAAAHSALSKAVSAHPDDVGALVALGQLDFRSNRCGQAISRLSHALQVADGAMTGSQQQSARALLADCQLRTGDAEAAQKNIDAILAANQHNPFGNYLQALMDIRRGEYRDAANHVQATLNVTPHNLRSMTLMAWIRIAQGQPQAAQPFLTRVLSRAPDDMAALRLQAGLWMAQDQDEQARDLLQQAYQRHPDQPGLHEALADVVAQLKQEQAGNAQDNSLANISLQLDLARSLAQMGSETAAQTVLSKIEPTTDSQRRAVAVARVRIALATGDYNGAIQHAEALAKNNPDDAEPRALLAQSYVAAGRYDDAADVLAKAHQADPDDASVVRAQAGLAARRGRYDDAIQYLEPLQRAHPDDTGLTLALAGLHARAGDTQQGIDLLQSAIERQPKADKLKQALARTYLASGQADQAQAVIDDQLDATDKVADWLHLKGVAQLMSGQTDAGLDTLAQAADKAPDRPEFALDVAKVELSHGQVQKAIDQLRQIRRDAPDFWSAAGFLALAEARAGNIDAARKQIFDLRTAGHDFAADVLDGDVLRRARQYRKADAAYAEAYRKQPSKRLAVAMFETRKAGGLDDPAKPLAQWLDRAPGDAAVALRLASWYQGHDKPT